MRLSQPTSKIWIKIDPYYQRQKCRPMTLVSGDIWYMRIFAVVKKRLKPSIALIGKPASALRSVTRHMGSHSVTCHPTQVNAPAITPANQAGTRFTYPGRMEGWVDLGSLIAARPGIEPTSTCSQARRLKRYATESLGRGRQTIVGLSTTTIFSFFAGCFFRNFRDEASIII